VHGHCVGGGVDLITACDIRYCSKDAWFTVKEVDVGLGLFGLFSKSIFKVHFKNNMF
jgi:enoyl-CoA hydratase/carnithine racemase